MLKISISKLKEGAVRCLGMGLAVILFVCAGVFFALFFLKAASVGSDVQVEQEAQVFGIVASLCVAVGGLLVWASQNHRRGGS